VQDEFRIDLELVGGGSEGRGTLLMARWDKDPANVSGKSVTMGYGRGFESACVQHHEELKDSTSYHRTIQYNLGSLKCLVQYEADAYMCDCHSGPISEDANPCTPASTQPEGSHISHPEHSNSHPHQDDETEELALRILRVGRPLPASCLIEIKSRENRNRNRACLDDIMPQLYLSYTQRIYIGLHTRGVFSDDPGTRERNMSRQIANWEARNRDALRGFVRVLEKISEMVRQACRADEGEKRRTKFAIVYRVPRSGGGRDANGDGLAGRLCIYCRDQEETAMVPDELVKTLWPSTI
jgi:hypothetical protein